MNEKPVGRVHWSFWTIGGVALIWNITGVMNFFVQLNPSMLADMPEAQRAIIEGRPAWATGAFAIAVFGGVLGCLLLLFRKSIANYLFIASLLGVIVQTIPYLGIIRSTVGPFEIAMFVLMPLAVAAFLIWYAKRAERNGWIC